MNGDLLSRHDHVVRYCKPGDVENGLPTANAFKLRRAVEDSLSVNWLEICNADNRADGVAQIREALRPKLTLKPTGRLAVLNVGEGVQQAVAATSCKLSFVHLPEDADESYTRVYGYPDDLEVELALAIELIRLIELKDVFQPAP